MRPGVLYWRGLTAVAADLIATKTATTRNESGRRLQFTSRSFPCEAIYSAEDNGDNDLEFHWKIVPKSLKKCYGRVPGDLNFSEEVAREGTRAPGCLA